MIGTILSIGLKLVVPAIQVFSKKSRLAAEWERRLTRTLSELENRASVPARVRESHQRAREEADARWEAIRNGVSAEPGNRDDLSIVYPAEVFVGKPFKIEVRNAPIGSVIMVDGKWVLGHIREPSTVLLPLLNTAGERVLNLNLGDKTLWSGPVTCKRE